MHMYRQSVAVSSLPHLDADPTDLSQDEVASNLYAYLALWHPGVLVRSEQLPRWAATYELYDDLDDALLLTAPAALDAADPEWESRATGAGATILTAGETLDETLAILAEHLGTDLPNSPEARDFFALGLARLWWSIAVLHLGREEGLDLGAFHNEVLEAARCTEETARHAHLAEAIKHLERARERVYPVEIYTVPLLYLKSPPPESSLAPFFDHALPFNLVVTARSLQRLATEKPEIFDRLRALLDSGRCEIVGGEWQESRHTLLPTAIFLENLHRGMNTYRNLTGTAPQAYGRRSFGLASYVPQILNRINVYYALHFSMDGATFPEHYEPRIRWEGLATSSVQALTRLPHNMADPRDVLAYGRAVAQTIASDHVATTTWAYDPAEPSLLPELVARVARLTPAFGRWYTLSDYFQTTEPVDMSVHPPDDDYRSTFLLLDHLRQHEHPVSRYAQQWRTYSRFFTLCALDAIAHTLRYRKPPVQDEIDIFAISRHPETPESLSRVEEERISAITRVLCKDVPGRPPALLAINPSPEPACVAIPDTTDELVRLRPLGQPCILNPVERPTEPEFLGVAEVPALGYSVLPQEKRAVDLPISLSESDQILEIAWGPYTATIDRDTGALRGIGRAGERFPRLGIRLCARGFLAEAPSESQEPYVVPTPTHCSARMAAQRVHVLHSRPAFAEIVTEGILVGDPPPEGSPSGLLARFRLAYQITAGSNVLRLACEFWDVQSDVFSDDSPWSQYLGFTLAWPDPATAIVRGTGCLRVPTRKQRFEAPAFIELHDPPRYTAVITAGLPFYVRTHGRMADLILVTQTEKARFFEIAVALDPHNPYHTLASLLCPPILVRRTGTAPRGPETGWFFHIDAQNIALLDLRALDPEGKRYRLRLLETAGQPTRVRVRCWRPIETAFMTDFLGEVLFEADCADDYIDVDVLAHELVQLEVRLK